MFNLFAIAILLYVMCNKTEGLQIIDMSQDCSNNLKANYFLTYGMGYPDGVHIVINNYHKNCTINLYSEKSKPEIAKLIFLQVESIGNHRESCLKNNITLISDGKAEKVQCRNGEARNFFEGIFHFHKTSVRIIGDGFAKIDLRATSAKNLESGDNCVKDENIICTINRKDFCIDAELQCEFYELCGHFGSYNTVTRTCNLSRNLKLGFFQNHRLIVTAGLIFSLVLLLILLKLCCLAVPKISRKFFKSPENLDNKLIVAQSIPIKKKISTREVKTIIDKKRTDSEDFELDIQTSLYYQTRPRKKRLTTNSPVYRASRTSNLLGSLSDDRTSQSSNFDEDETEVFGRMRRKRRSNLI